MDRSAPPRITPLGDRALIITFGTTIDEPTHRRVRAATSRLRDRPPAGLVDLVPAFASVTLHYAPERAPAGPPDASPFDVTSGHSGRRAG